MTHCARHSPRTHIAKGLGPTSTGSFRAIEFQNPDLSSGCAVTMAAYERVGGVLTLQYSTVVGCHDDMEVRVAAMDGATLVFIDGHNVLAVGGTSSLVGKGGVGVRSAPASNTISLVQLGARDRVGPTPIDPNTVAIWTTPTSISLQWAGVSDDANGRGLWRYAFSCTVSDCAGHYMRPQFPPCSGSGSGACGSDHFQKLYSSALAGPCDGWKYTGDDDCQGCLCEEEDCNSCP